MPPNSALTATAPVAFRVIALLAAATDPLMVNPPVFVTVTLPVPLWLIPVTVSVLTVLVRLMVPLGQCLVAFKLPTALVSAPLSVWPVPELVVNKPVVATEPLPDW